MDWLLNKNSKLSDLKYLYSKFIPDNSNMNFNEIARQLKDNIRSGKENETRQLLEPYTNPKEIHLIEEKFLRLFDSPKDPINYAIECKQEKTAIYLVEKSFSLDYLYCEDIADKEECDNWCVKDHGPDKCPSLHDCSRNAEKNHMEALKLRLDAIKQGKRRPGEGISEPYIDKHMPHSPPPRQKKLHNVKDIHNRFISQKQTNTHADNARKLLERFGNRFCDKEGRTLLHLSVEQPSVYIYVLANNGVPVNIQDKHGDTALHLAVRKGRLDTVEALVQCTADLTVRNKFGSMPIEEADGPIKKLLTTFQDRNMLPVFKRFLSWGHKNQGLFGKKVEQIRQNTATSLKLVRMPGVVFALRNSHFNMLYKHYKCCWCSLDTKVKGDQTLLEWTAEMAESPTGELRKKMAVAKNSLRILSEYKPTSDLIHAVLCEDLAYAKQVLEANPDLSVNIRFRDRKGKTLLSHAIEVNNFDLVKLLIQKGAHVAQIRVRENEQTDVTVPLYQKALKKDLDVNIVKLLQTVLPDSREHEEKDVNGNTPLLRAIEEGVDSRTIHWLIKDVRGGYSLLDRNAEGLTARELASQRGRDNVVKMIDRYLTKEIPPIVLRQFPVSFYSADLLTIVDENKEENETGDSLEQRMTKAAEDHKMKTWVDFNQTQNQAIALFTAAAKGDIKKIDTLNDAEYQDVNGYTALIRAIAFNQLVAAKELCTKRPSLKRTPDNSNRYPLHYAYALPEDQAKGFIRLLLGKDANEIENRVDKDDRVAAVYKEQEKPELRGEILQMLYDARTLSAFGKRGAPLAPWPDKAETKPPNMQDGEMHDQHPLQQSKTF